MTDLAMPDDLSRRSHGARTTAEPDQIVAELVRHARRGQVWCLHVVGMGVGDGEVVDNSLVPAPSAARVDRVVAWGFVKSLLSQVWSDGRAREPTLRLAERSTWLTCCDPSCAGL